jgi:NADH:ubiquinone oxidoreductase subunit H
MISYEVSIGLIIISVVFVGGSYNLSELVVGQHFM